MSMNHEKILVVQTSFLLQLPALPAQLARNTKEMIAICFAAPIGLESLLQLPARSYSWETQI